MIYELTFRPHLPVDTVAAFANELRKSPAALLEQLKSAGVEKEGPSDALSEADKAKLLAYLQASHGTATHERKRITLARREPATCPAIARPEEAAGQRDACIASLLAVAEQLESIVCPAGSQWPEERSADPLSHYQLIREGGRLVALSRRRVSFAMLHAYRHMYGDDVDAGALFHIRTLVERVFDGFEKLGQLKPMRVAQIVANASATLTDDEQHVLQWSLYILAYAAQPSAHSLQIFKAMSREVPASQRGLYTGSGRMASASVASVSRCLYRFKRFLPSCAATIAPARRDCKRFISYALN